MDGGEVAALDLRARPSHSGGGRGRIPQHDHRLAEPGHVVRGAAWGGAKQCETLPWDDPPIGALVDHQKLIGAQHRSAVPAKQDRGGVVVADSPFSRHRDHRRPLQGHQLVAAAYLRAHALDHRTGEVLIDHDGPQPAAGLQDAKSTGTHRGVRRGCGTTGKELGANRDPFNPPQTQPHDVPRTEHLAERDI
jgi:hypothetical protein